MPVFLISAINNVKLRKIISIFPCYTKKYVGNVFWLEICYITMVLICLLCNLSMMPVCR